MFVRRDGGGRPIVPDCEMANPRGYIERVQREEARQELRNSRRNANRRDDDSKSCLTPFLSYIVGLGSIAGGIYLTYYGITNYKGIIGREADYKASVIFGPLLIGFGLLVSCSTHAYSNPDSNSKLCQGLCCCFIVKAMCNKLDPVAERNPNATRLLGGFLFTALGIAASTYGAMLSVETFPEIMYPTPDSKFVSGKTFGKGVGAFILDLVGVCLLDRGVNILSQSCRPDVGHTVKGSFRTALGTGIVACGGVLSAEFFPKLSLLPSVAFPSVVAGTCDLLGVAFLYYAMRDFCECHDARNVIRSARNIHNIDEEANVLMQARQPVAQLTQANSVAAVAEQQKRS